MGATTDTALLSGPQLEAWEGLMRTVGVLSRALDVEVQHVHGISLREYEVLLKLFHADDHSLKMTDLGQRVSLTQSGISRNVAGLEKRNLVERRPCKDDRRVQWAHLTDEGLALFSAARSTHHARVMQLFSSQLSDDEAAMMASLFQRVLDTADPCAVAREVMGDDAPADCQE